MIQSTTDFLMDLLDMNDKDDAACAVRHLAADVAAPDMSAKAQAQLLREQRDEFDTWPDPEPAPTTVDEASAVVRHLLADVALPPAGAKTPTDELLGLV